MSLRNLHLKSQHDSLAVAQHDAYLGWVMNNLLRLVKCTFYAEHYAPD